MLIYSVSTALNNLRFLINKMHDTLQINYNRILSRFVNFTNEINPSPVDATGSRQDDVRCHEGAGAQDLTFL